MENLSKTGRVFYGTVIAEMGFHILYYRDFPYMLIPPKHAGIPGVVFLAYLSGILLVLAGACIVFEKKIRSASLLLGSVLLLIFCLYFVPYQLLVSPNALHFGDWENAAKELALCGGAFVIAGGYPEKEGHPLVRALGKLAPFGAILFSITIISFSMDHFLYAKEAADYVPSWVPGHLFWIYFTGMALLASGVAILLNIKRQLAATLLGSMILAWFVMLHVPRVSCLLCRISGVKSPAQASRWPIAALHLSLPGLPERRCNRRSEVIRPGLCVFEKILLPVEFALPAHNPRNRSAMLPLY